MANVTLHWRDRSNNETGFEIERCQGSTCTNFIKIATLPPNTTTYTDTGLLAGTSYRYRVRAFNNRGKSSYSNIIAVTTTPVPVPDPIPIPPTPTPDPPPLPPPVPPPSDAYSRYVSLGGNNSNPGTIDFPWRTLSYAKSQLIPGYSLFIHGGLWQGVDNVFNDLFGVMPSGNGSNPINIISYPGEQVVIQVPDTLAGILLTGGQQYINFLSGGAATDFVIDGVNQVTDVTGQLVYIAGASSYNTMRKMEIKNSKNFGIQVTGNGGDAKFNQFLDLLVHDNGDNAGANTNGHGYYIGAPDNTIAGGKTYRNKGMGLQVNAGSGNVQCSRTKIYKVEGYDNAQRVSTSAMNFVVAHGTDILLYDLLSYQTDSRTNLAGILIYTGTINTMCYNSTATKHRYFGMGCQFYDGAPQFKNNIMFNNTVDFEDDGGTGSPVMANNLIGINPSFIDSPGNNFHLNGSSPAAHAGITLSVVPDDLDGKLRSSVNGYTIGAYEI